MQWVWRLLIVSVLGLMLCIRPGIVSGQYYPTTLRPPMQEWMQLETENFRVIYPKRYSGIAKHALRTLETEMSSVQSLMGGKIRRFPVILNPENDLSNGYVTPILFRSEVEIAPITGKVMNPASGDWMSLVLPHELVHVMHYSIRPAFSPTNVIGLFSPDFRRSIHSTAPFGVHEGVAVHHETHGLYRSGGRGAYPYFLNQYQANAASGDPWSMGQLLSVTDYTPPFDRHYLGGYRFMNWLIEAYGEEAMRSAIETNYSMPFLGFGFALRTATGRWPSQLYREFRDQRDEHDAGTSTGRRHATMEASSEVMFEATCRRLQRPVWLDDKNLLFYARSCNRPAGFYKVERPAASDVMVEPELVKETALTMDRIYTRLDSGGAGLPSWMREPEDGTLAASFGEGPLMLYARYHTDRYYDAVFRGDVHLLDTRTGRSVRLTRGERLSSPVVSKGALYALQVEGDRHRLVRLGAGETGDDAGDETGSGGFFTSSGLMTTEAVLHQPEKSTVVQVEVRPATGQADDVDQLADIPNALILGREGTRQAIWLQTLDTETDSVMSGEPLLAADGGSLFDPSWHPDGGSFLFVSDHTGVMQVYEYDLKRREVIQLTEVPFNAFEASYSPDGSRIAYVAQVEDEQRVFVIERSRMLRRGVRLGSENGREEGVGFDEAHLDRASFGKADSVMAIPEPTVYRTGISWLKPRIWLPSYEKEAGRDRWGVQFESVDVMSRNAYSLELSHFADKVWYQFRYTNKFFYPGLQFELSSEPQDVVFRVNYEGEQLRFPFLQQSRVFSVSLPFVFRFEQQARFTALAVQPELSWSAVRLLDAQSSNITRSSFAGTTTLGLSAALSLNVRRLSRDIQPSAGWTFYGEVLAGLNEDELEVDVRVEDQPAVLRALLDKRRGLRLGVSAYAAPFSRWNQSLRTGLAFYSQTELPVFNTNSEVSDHFAGQPLAGIRNAAILNQRYTIPLVYPDDGGVLLPFYLSNVYAELFAQTLADLDGFRDGGSAAYQTLLGMGLRTRFRFGLIPVDFGVSVGVDLGTGRTSVLLGTRP